MSRTYFSQRVNGPDAVMSNPIQATLTFQLIPAAPGVSKRSPITVLAQSCSAFEWKVVRIVNTAPCLWELASELTVNECRRCKTDTDAENRSKTVTETEIIKTRSINSRSLIKRPNKKLLPMKNLNRIKNSSQREIFLRHFLSFLIRLAWFRLKPQKLTSRNFKLG